MKYNNIYICIIALCDIVFSSRFIIDTIKKKKKKGEMKEKKISIQRFTTLDSNNKCSFYNILLHPPSLTPLRHYFLISH